MDEPRILPLIAGTRDRWLIRPFRTVEVVRIKGGWLDPRTGEVRGGMVVWGVKIYLN